MSTEVRPLTPKSKKMIDRLVSRRQKGGPTEITEEEFEENRDRVFEEEGPMIKEAVKDLQPA